MKSIIKTQLSVFWRSIKKAWITYDLFNDWFYNCFNPAVNLYDGKIICILKFFLLNAKFKREVLAELKKATIVNQCEDGASEEDILPIKRRQVRRLISEVTVRMNVEKLYNFT